MAGSIMKGASALLLGVTFFLITACDILQIFLYHPGNTSLGDVQHYVAANNLLMWPDNGVTYQGIITRKGPPFFKGTIVVFHGSGGAAMFRTCYLDALENRGYRVVLAEYPGYGGRPGELNEKSLVADARRTALRAKEAFGGPVFVWGESLGCGIASGLAADSELQARGVVLITPWDRFQNEAEAKCSWTPASLCLPHKYDNVGNLWSFRGRIAVIMSGRDEVIPNKLTKRLYASLPQSKKLWVFENSGHCDWPNAPHLEWWDEVVNFLEAAD